MNDWNVKSSEAQIKAEADMRLANVEDYLPFQSQPKAWRKRKVWSSLTGSMAAIGSIGVIGRYTVICPYDKLLRK
jgi:hypothetical protein